MSKRPQNRPIHKNSFWLIRQLWADHIRNYLWRLVGAFILISILAGVTGLYPIVIKYSYDLLAKGEMSYLWIIMLAMVGVTALKGLLDYLQAVYTNRISITLGLDMQKRLYAHLMQADFKRLSSESPGNLVTRVNGDLVTVQGAIMAVFTVAIRDVLTVFSLVVSMLYLDWVMTVVILLFYPLAVFPIAQVGRIVRKYASHGWAQIGNTTAVLIEHLSSLRLIKTYRLEQYSYNRVSDQLERAVDFQRKTVRVKAALNPILEVFGGLAVAGVVGLAAYRISQDSKTVGDFTGFIAALLMAAQPIRSFGNLNNRIQEGLAAAERFYQVLTEKPTVVSPPDAKPLTLIGGGRIEFENVSFSYNNDGRNAVRDFSLTIEPNTTVALVGKSGAGKSTIFNLVPRLYDPQSGRILIDGQDIQQVTVASIRDQMALVSQDITLFDDTVAANIALGRLDATHEDIVAAAKAANAHDFIERLPEGYDARLGDRGMRLSGGQRQRVALARAILRDAPILLLDEATSALDAESERLVQEALAKFSESRTTLVIAHRLSTVKNADMICVMEDGFITEKGRHAELLARDGAYAQFCKSQMLTPEDQDYAKHIAALGGKQARASEESAA
ncbi:ABC transporter related protein [Rhodomicrobium vannielii ATCC 17100]|uniref:ABC transporter related protein n=1 Tax=Rhodomicrobium vannielii (strain ATCC 17100 / DSM 162 / LMG 4299 / NCIMB 10020 / ATH 3.1.1) TaxID=648757 RepID=E3I3M9_RHOVT|nr:ABC transporter ATP-binding protein [Rhodomicrobium vannielii]ADP70376.1 ABC transporter related protein [Rhodomicrobium vannielii ATCC 17100]